MLPIPLLAAFLLAPDTLPSTAAETATRMQRIQEMHARETRDQQRTRPTPRRQLEAERPSMTAEERAELNAAVERFARERAGEVANLRKTEPDRDCR